MDQNYQKKMILMDNSGGLSSGDYLNSGLPSGDFLNSGSSSNNFSSGGFTSSTKETSYERKVVTRTTQVSHQYENSAFITMENDFEMGNNLFKFDYDKDLLNSGKKEIIRVSKCPTIAEAVKFIASSLYDLNVIGFQVKLEYSSTASLSDSDFMQILEKLQKHRSILIMLETINNDFLISWKLKGLDTFFNAKIEPGHSKLVDFIKNHLIASFKIRHNGLLPSFNFDEKSLKIDIELYSMGDRRGLNLLSLAAKSGDFQTVKSLIKLGFDVQIAVDGRSAADFAYQEKHFGCLLELLRFNSLYPCDFKADKVSDEVKTFMKISTNLHNAIKDKKEEEVHEILELNLQLRHFYDTENNSAVTHALNNQAFKIYEIFVKKNISFGPQEDIDGIMDSVDGSRGKLKKIHEKQAHILIEKHLTILIANSSVGHDTKNDQVKLNAVSKAYKVLDEDRRTSMILKIVAARRNFQITFDFKREHVDFMNPNAEPYTNGLFTTTGKILIGAKQLLEPGQEHFVYGVLAHELCHFAMFIVFKNMAKPYFKRDKKEQEIFATIAKECEGTTSTENLVKSVFENYPTRVQHAELIVTVPNMIGYYFNDKETLNERETAICSLFNHFDEKTMKAMEKALPEIEKKAEKKIKEKYLNATKRFTTWKKILLIFVIFLLLFGIACAAYYFFPRPVTHKNLASEETTSEPQGDLRESSVMTQLPTSRFGRTRISKRNRHPPGELRSFTQK